MYKWNVIITTYEMIIADTSVFQPIRWKYLIIDEAHRLKNRQSRIATELKQFKYDQLLLLTGTPIQNNTEELWTLLNLLDRDKFPYVSPITSLLFLSFFLFLSLSHKFLNHYETIVLLLN
jgi:SNF2 family DNA or RNA helicase